MRLPLRIRFFFFTFFFPLLVHSSGRSGLLEFKNFYLEHSEETAFIRHINIFRQDMFDTSHVEFRKFPFPLINKFHIKTKKQVISRELLFHEGEAVDFALLEESERNLRALQYIGDAFISPRFVSPDSIDIDVVTEEQWTTVLGTKYEVEAGQANYGLRLEEYNLLGWGQKFKISLAHLNGQDQQEFLVAENRLFNSRIAVEFFYKGYEDGTYQSYHLGRPFYSERSPWAFDVDFQTYEGTRRVFNHQNTIATYQAQENMLNCRASHLLLRRDHSSARASFLFYSTLQDQDKLTSNDSLFQFLPAAHRTRMLGGGIDWVKLNFIEEHFLDNFGLIEDVSLGWEASLYLGKMIPELGSVLGQWYVDGKITHAWKWFNQFYLYASFGSYAYFGGQSPKETVSTVLVKAYLQTIPYNTIILNGNISRAWRIPDHEQLFLGENRGLRGYPSYFRTGQNRIILNLEDRIFSKLNLYSFGFGAAVFSDLGYIWNEQQPLRDQRPFVTLGAGIRIGSSKSKAATVFRLDFAVALQNDPHFVLSFGNSHFFSAFQKFSFVSSFPKKFGEFKE